MGIDSRSIDKRSQCGDKISTPILHKRGREIESEAWEVSTTETKSLIAREECSQLRASYDS